MFETEEEAAYYDALVDADYGAWVAEPSEEK